jgi:hypothetical protein
VVLVVVLVVVVVVAPTPIRAQRIVATSHHLAGSVVVRWLHVVLLRV